MKNPNKSKAVISIFIFSLLAACGGGESQVAEANKLVAEANKSIVEAEDLVKKTEKKNKELFAAYIETDEDLQEYRQEMSANARSIIENFEKAASLTGNASGKFAEAGKLDVPEKFKEYLETKSQEFAKRSEAVEARKDNAQVFLDYDDASMIKKFEENNERSEKLSKEARELGEKAGEIQKENEDVFES